jgi:hydrogenase nickel incorporation protein HypA/HybF
VHEYSIVRALVTRVQEEARARRATAVGRVSLRIGELSGIEVELLRTAYLMCRERTICEHAALDVEVVPAEWICRNCQSSIVPGGPLRCATCGGAAVLRAGDEILLERIEMEVA